MTLIDAARSYLAVLANPSRSGLAVDDALTKLVAAVEEHDEKPEQKKKPKAAS